MVGGGAVVGGTVVGGADVVVGAAVVVTRAVVEVRGRVVDVAASSTAVRLADSAAHAPSAATIRAPAVPPRRDAGTVGRGLAVQEVT